MNYSAAVSLLIGFIAVFGSFLLDGGKVSYLFLLPAITIVFVGTLAAGSAGSSLKLTLSIPKFIKIAFFPPKYQEIIYIKKILLFAILARKEGVLSLEGKLLQVEHVYLRRLVQMCIDGADKKMFRSIFELEMENLNDRHHSIINFFNKLGGYSPTMGIIGTVMGLINTLAAAGNEPNQLIHHIATAFIATLWGILLANLLWYPIADKLTTTNDEEIRIKSLMFEGTLGIISGETPTVIQAKLLSFFSEKQQTKVNEELTEYVRNTSKSLLTNS